MTAASLPPASGRRTLVVGDVHGCVDELSDLLRAAALRPAEDRLIAVGDLVGKGPAGHEVVRFFREGGHESVLGNHDEKLLRWRRAQDRGEEPGDLRSPTHARDAAALSDADWRWLADLPLTLPLPHAEALVVHAGVVPGVPLRAQDPAFLMNLRSILPNGRPSANGRRGIPWASCWRGPPFVLFGHDAVRGLQRWPAALGLDTGCVYGGQLSGFLLPERRVLQVDARRAYAAVG